MPQDILLTPEMRVDCNGIPMNTLSGNIRIQADMVPKTGTEDEASRVKKSPLRKAMFNVTMQRESPDPGYHTAGLLDLLAQEGCWIRIWRAGRSDPTLVDDFPVVIFGEETDNWNEANSSAQEIQLTGETDGPFMLAGEP